MKTKFLLAFLAATVFSHPALAANYSLGDVNTTTNSLVSGANLVPAGVITDTLSFSLSQDSFVGMTLTNLPTVLSIGGQQSTVLDISGLAGDVYKDVGGTLTYQGSLSGTSTILTANSLSLGSGNWVLSVTGTATGTGGGQYSYAITAAPVPEVSTWALMLAGLGLVGMQLRRRDGGPAHLAD